MLDTNGKEELYKLRVAFPPSQNAKSNCTHTFHINQLLTSFIIKTLSKMQNGFLIVNSVRSGQSYQYSRLVNMGKIVLLHSSLVVMEGFWKIFSTWKRYGHTMHFCFDQDAYICSLFVNVLSTFLYVGLKKLLK